MAMELTPLDPNMLSTAAQRALGPGPGRMMASRGMMPLPPGDQVAVLYNLHLDSDAMIAASARSTASGLPEKLLAGTLADPTLDPRILHFFGERSYDKVAVFDAIALNPSVADATLAMLASKGDARAVDQIAQNEQRLLRHPEIIGAMYMNRKARMSTIDRVIELAVRNQVRVPGLACWDEVARALSGGSSSANEDELFAEVADALSVGDDAAITKGDTERDLTDEEEAEKLALAKKAEEKKIPFNMLSVPAKIRVATLGDAYARSLAIRDPVKIVSMAAIKSPGLSDMEAAVYARNQALAEEIIRYIASRREWTKMYGVRVSLCRNPKTPIAESSRLLPLLRQKDLVNLSKSRGIPSAVVAQARKLLSQRSGGDGKK
ncbi:MAG: hypothetical protein H0T46_04335 [Deltaproteobacteria bacterium]|nr:hypothetical protein [Deltaproteobacteria bacterium]